MIDDTPGSSHARSLFLLSVWRERNDLRRTMKALLVLWKKIPKPDQATKDWIERFQDLLEDN